jgi:hypothetical protein
MVNFQSSKTGLEEQLLMKKTGLTSKQIDNWFLYQLKK